jgi:hypothetical protein
VKPQRHAIGLERAYPILLGSGAEAGALGRAGSMQGLHAGGPHVNSSSAPPAPPDAECPGNAALLPALLAVSSGLPSAACRGVEELPPQQQPTPRIGVARMGGRGVPRDGIAERAGACAARMGLSWVGGGSASPRRGVSGVSSAWGGCQKQKKVAERCRGYRWWIVRAGLPALLRWPVGGADASWRGGEGELLLGPPAACARGFC